MDTLHKSFTFSVKSTDQATRVIEGYAATFGNKDLVSDIIAPGAFAESLRIRKPKMLAQHDTSCVIGMWDEVTEDSNGLYVKGRFANTAEGNDMYELAKMGAIDSMSIGYTVVDFEWDGDQNIRTLKKLELWEASLVTFPANEQAKITQVKTAPANVRDFEKFLREEGKFSRADATTIALHGFKALQSTREAGDEGQKEQEAILQLLNRNINLLN